MTNSLPLTSIIIPSWNRKTWLKNCLKSVFKNTKPPFEIIIVDGGSTDGTKQMLEKISKKQPKIRSILLERNLGPAEQRNIGVKKAKGKYLMFLDSDTEVCPEWLKGAVKFLEKNPNIGGGQLKILRKTLKKRFDSVGEKLTSFGTLTERARDAEDIGQFDYPEKIFSGKTAAMIFKKSILKKAGGFDPDYFIFWEEPDLCWRIWKLGYSIFFLPMGKVYHGYDTRKPNQAWLNRLTFFGCRNQLTTILKNGVGWFGIKMFLFALFSWIILVILFLIKLDLAKAKSVITAIGDLILNLPKTVKKRLALKKKLADKFYSDKNWLKEVMVKQNIGWYLGKGVNYVFGKPF